LNLRKASGENLTCSIPPIRNKLQAPEVHACRLNLPRANNLYNLEITMLQGGQVTIFEPALTAPVR
jgi:hypothetical protein